MAATKLTTASQYHIDPNVFKVLKGLAIDNARRIIETTAVADLTDSSGGTAAASFVDMTVPTAAFDATSAGGATRTAFNTAVGKLENAGRVLVNSMNNVRARVGLPLMTAASGTQATANTIPAQDLTVATTSGATSLDYAEGRALMDKAKNNVSKLVQSFNEILRVLGMTPVSNALGGNASNLDLVALTAAAASATGASAVSKAVADAFLTASADNLATLAQYWNYTMAQAGFTDLTDSSGGTAATGLAANANPAAAAGAATTSSPKAGFDAQLVIIENALSEICTNMNAVRSYYGLARYTDSTGVTPNGTVEAMSVTLTAVDGSTGTLALDAVTAAARMNTIKNAQSSLAVGINELAAIFGTQPLTDALGGTASTTIANIAATAAGVGEDTVPGGTMLDSAVDAWLVINRNNISTLVAAMNAVTGTDVAPKPLSVVVS